MRAVLDLKNASFYLDTTPEALRELVKQRQIPYSQRGKKIYFDIEELDAWRRELRIVSAEEAISNLRKTAQFTDPLIPHHPGAPPETQGSTIPIQLTRGPRTHVSATSAHEQSR